VCSCSRRRKQIYKTLVPNCMSCIAVTEQALGVRPPPCLLPLARQAYPFPLLTVVEIGRNSAKCSYGLIDVDFLRGTKCLHAKYIRSTFQSKISRGAEEVPPAYASIPSSTERSLDQTFLSTAAVVIHRHAKEGNNSVVHVIRSLPYKHEQDFNFEKRKRLARTRYKRHDW